MSIAIGIVIAVLVGLAILLRQGAEEHERVQAELDAIAVLPLDRARHLAKQLLERPGLFQCKPASGAVLPLGLPSSVSELLTQYDEVLKGEFWIAREALAQPPKREGFIKLGEDFEFTEILARSGDDRVFVAYGEQPASEEPEVEPSVWHLIIQISGEKLEPGAG